MKKITKKSSPKDKPHNHNSQLNRLFRIKGQLEGIDKMICDNRYCPDIVIQIKAARSALRSLEVNIIENHIKHCVSTAIKSRDQKTIDKKIQEVLSMIKGQNV